MKVLILGYGFATAILSTIAFILCVFNVGAAKNCPNVVDISRALVFLVGLLMIEIYIFLAIYFMRLYNTTAASPSSHAHDDIALDE